MSEGKEEHPRKPGDNYIGKSSKGTGEPSLQQNEAYELIIEVCMQQIAERYADVYAEWNAMSFVFRQISALIRGEMTERHLDPNTLEPHALALQLLELHEQAYNGLLPDGTPDPGIFLDP